jgi:transposase-like protein
MSVKCKTCKKCFSETRGTVFFQLNTAEEEILRTVSMIPENGGIRGLARATGHSKNTIIRWLDIVGTHSKEVTTYFLTNLNIKRVEVLVYFLHSAASTL